MGNKKINSKNIRNIEALAERIDSIEKLLKMLLVNSLLDEMDENKESKTFEENTIMIVTEEFKEVVKQYNMTAKKCEEFKGYTLVYIEPSKEVNYTARDFQDIDRQIKSEFELTIPVFCFERLYGMQRRIFVDENISFYIKKRELHLSIKEDSNKKEGVL